MQKCSFCGEIYEFPRGLTYVTSEGKISYFCSSKCRKNALKLNRDKLKVNWVRKSPENKAEAGKSAEASRKHIAAKAAELAESKKKEDMKEEAKKDIDNKAANQESA